MGPVPANPPLRRIDYLGIQPVRATTPAARTVDDNPMAARLRPALTTVRQDVAEKGRIAAAALLDIVSTGNGSPGVAREESAGPLHVVLRTKSSAAAPAGHAPSTPAGQVNRRFSSAKNAVARASMLAALSRMCSPTGIFSTD